MSTRPIYRFQRGEPITIGRRVLSGDPSGYSVTAKLKKSQGQNVPPAAAPIAATFDVQFEPAIGDQAARWMMCVPGEVTATLDAGHYAVDARFSLNGAVEMITEPAFVTLVESVSG